MRSRIQGFLRGWSIAQESLYRQCMRLGDVRAGTLMNVRMAQVFYLVVQPVLLAVKSVVIVLHEKIISAQPEA